MSDDTDLGGVGHSRTWPAYFDRKPREKTPAALLPRGKSWQLVTSAGESFDVGSHAELVRKAIAGQLDVWTAGITDYPYLAEALSDERTTCQCSEAGTPFGLFCKGPPGQGQFKVFIGESLAWDYKRPTVGFLDALARLYGHLGIGAYATPGSLGQRAMRYHHGRQSYTLQRRLPVRCQSDILTHNIGGRVDHVSVVDPLPIVYEIDLRNAYASAATGELPIGTAVQVRPGVDLFSSANRALYPHWFSKVAVYLPAELERTPILRRAGDNVLHVKAQGWHGDYGADVWLWREEAEEALKLGAIIVNRGGWAWTAQAPMLRQWALWAHEKRQAAPDAEVAAMVKATIVAAIGRHGMRPMSYQLVLADQASERARPMVRRGPGGPELADYWLDSSEDTDAPALAHWYGWIIAQIRLAMYREATEQERLGNTVIAINYDALTTLEPSRSELAPEQLGGFRQRELTAYRSPYARAVISDQKIRLPGVRRIGREVP